MASISERAVAGSPWSLSMAFVERQTNLWKRYWGWELVWLVYGVVNTLAITLIAEQVGSVSVAALAVLAGVLPLLYPERGSQMSLMVQASLLLISGVYYEVEVLPAWLQAVSVLSPATYILDGIRSAMIDGRGVVDVAGTLDALAVFGAVLVPMSVAVFAWAESYAKRTGKLKRQG